jgi:hypothetical protein
VSEDRLRRADLVTPWRGVRSDRMPSSLAARARALSLVLPDDAVFSRTTAARLLDLPLPSRARESDPLHVSTPRTSPQIRRTGVVGHRTAGPRRPLDVNGLRIDHPVTVWADLAVSLEIDDLVALGDAIVNRVPRLLPELGSEVARRPGRAGTARARQALDLVRVGSASVMETRARLVFVRADLPTPLLNHDIHRSSDGAWIARPDFTWLDQRVVAEYDGDQHRTGRRQWQHDIARRRLLRAEGYEVYVFTADDVLRFPHDLVADLRRLLGR